MSRRTKNLKLQSGFTMIELLMVIMLIAILGAVALPQFLDFRTEGRIAAANAVLYNINTGILFQKTNARIKCASAPDAQIPLDSLAANDITAGASPLCSQGQITNPNERRFLDAAAFPPNPYNQLITVGDCVNTTYVGYCYNETNGTVTVSTATSHSNTCTSCFQNSAGQSGASSVTCSGSGCIQNCSGNSGDCSASCPGGYCTQACAGNSGNCSMSCYGGNCTQTCAGNSGSCTTSCTGGNCTVL